LTALARLWRDHRLLVLAFCGAVLLGLGFGVRSALYWAHWSDPASRDAQIEGWMTPRYVALSWGVDREVVAGALGLDPGGGRRQTLAEIAQAKGVPLAEVEAALMAAILAARADR
jgi:ABC-type dipeptide/oligopeptide/nickel transport system permease component